MNEVLLCQFCQKDPFEYVDVDGLKVAVVISCCEKAVDQYYQGLTTLSSKQMNQPFRKLEDSSGS